MSSWVLAAEKNYDENFIP